MQGAFTGGGAQIGNSGNLSNRWELTSATTYTKGSQVWRFGARLRQSFNGDTSVNNFGGTYTFLGGIGPVLDASNQPIAGSSTDLTALERYRRTLLFIQQGLSGAAIRALGGGASYFSLSAGTPITNVNQFDIGLFINNDWRARPNLTISYGVRYETQSNIHDFADWSPRVAVAWGVGRQRDEAGQHSGARRIRDFLRSHRGQRDSAIGALQRHDAAILFPDQPKQLPNDSNVRAISRQPSSRRFCGPCYEGIRAPRIYQAQRRGGSTDQ